ncbi:hypothetical protein EV702DRAFT_788807 [Suillus placidus]|uniref:Distal membrane-arm assembly complex protein 1-like domain-containing protein n=1 Tax=Suillus placidus TaxID=48579 RepID=A0A9P7CXI9_9AGAM|nr:hypothetical protein EV702DRAFT_788807 [Suillus placidus]KAG2338774.1 hypothetical protein BDR05DRAFT_968916 [Suillus weaverae]
MNAPESNTTSLAAPDSDSTFVPHLSSYNDCVTCRVIGSGAFAATGIYALRMARPGAPGSIVGKRIMGGLGVCFLVGSALRWRM